MRSAATGSTACRRRCNGGNPCSPSSFSSAARVCGSAGGSSDKPFQSAWKYIIVPPTSNGMPPPRCTRCISACTSIRKRETEYDSHGSIKSMSACGVWLRVSASGLAVPISMRLYTSAESTLMTSNPKVCRSSTANEVLPDAVGPSRQKTGGNDSTIKATDYRRADVAETAAVHISALAGKVHRAASSRARPRSAVHDYTDRCSVCFPSA